MEKENPGRGNGTGFTVNLADDTVNHIHNGRAKPIFSPAIPPARAAHIAAFILNRHSPGEIGQAVEILIDVLAMLEPATEDDANFSPVSDGKPGDATDHELDGTDQGDVAWLEWQSMRGNMKAGPNILAGREDDEDGGDSGDHSASEDDSPGIGTKALQRHYGNAGCPIADPGGDQHDGREPDTDDEIEQMVGCVPAPAIYSLDYNLFNDRRAWLAHPGPGGSVYFKVGEQMWKGEAL